MTAPTSPAARPTLLQWGVILWPSFIAAGLASVVFFAFVDPQQLGRISFPASKVSRELGYSVGFFMFWAVTAFSSAVTWYLQRPLRTSDNDDDDLPLE